NALHLDLNRHADRLAVSGDAVLELADARLSPGIDLTGVRGLIEVPLFRLDDDGYVLSGRLENLSVDCLRTKMTAIGGRFTVVPPTPTLEGISGNFYNGIIDNRSTFLEIHPSSPATYRGRLELRALDFKAMSESISLKSSEFRGRADLSLD